MATVDISHAHKYYNSEVVLEDISLRINKGEFLAIVGPSGCGKSTLLRLISGLEAVNAGKIAINGQCVNDIHPSQRDIAMVFQSYALYPHMTVFDNMAYGLKMRKIKKPEIAKRVQEAAEMLQLQPFLQRLPRDLSGGQRQRVAMGRAIVRKPAVFLFDEPLSNLDAKLRTEMRFEIKKLHQELKTTCIYVTHDQIEAMTLASRVLVLNKGKVEQLASPIEIYQKPASTFVASFIGQFPMNFMEAQAVTDNSGFLRISSKTGLEFGINNKQLSAACENKAIILGIRPEDFQLSPVGTPGSIPISIRFIDDMGSDKLIHAQSICGSHFFSIRTSKVLPMDSSLLAISCESSALHFFDKATGLCLGE